MSSVTLPKPKTVNPLANPKAVKNLCELCQKPAFTQCSSCKATYYCGIEHQRIDWVGIHKKICDDIKILRRTSLPFLSSEEERLKRKAQKIERQKNMISVTQTVGQKLLFESQYDQAIPAALQCLKFSIDVYGLSSIELVPSYLVLAEASIGLDKLRQAEEYLAQAEWTILKTPQVNNFFKSRLYRNTGLLLEAKNDYQESLRNFANDIYHASEEYGTDHIRTAGGYFYMGNVFIKLGKLEIADSLYEKVTVIWKNHLRKIIETTFASPLVNATIGPSDSEDVEQKELNEAELAEAKHSLIAILNFRVGKEVELPKKNAQIYIAMAYLNFYVKELDQTNSLVRKAMRSLESARNVDNLIDEVNWFYDNFKENFVK